MIKRIKSLISVKNLTASQFGDLLGVQRSNISHILSGRNKPSLDFILKITEHFPSISIEWLINGTGEMFKQDEKGKAKMPAQMEFLPLVADLDKENEEITDKNIGKSEEKKIKPEISEDTSQASIDIQKDETKKIVSSSIPANNEGIEQIMVLYKNGSFRVYTPQE
jgi:transcriptional regulator with XRE-family HTH domain